MTKAIFFDIDGTLLSFNTHKMPDSTRGALQKLKKKNIKLFISTGRGPSAFSEVKSLLDFEFDGYIMLNGQYCIINDKVIHELSIDVSSIESVLPYLKEKDISCQFVEVDYMYINKIGKRVLELCNLLGITDCLPTIDDENRIYSNKTYQLSSYISEDEEKDFLKHIPGCKAVRWNPLFADIIPEEGGKPTGVQKILEHFNIPKEESMAFGDGGNDIEMLQYAGIGIAMGNASDSVKKAADYVTADVDNDGIESALLKYNLL